MAGTRLITVIGRKDAGKTSLLVALTSELARRGRRVMTIKHGTHPATVDKEGRDTYRHFHEGRAERVLMEAPGQRVLFERTTAELDPVTLARRYLDGAEIVVAEGFKAHRLPKIEVHRVAVHPAPLFDPAHPEHTDWVAIVTDDATFRAPVPVLRFSDTVWIMTLAQLAWDKAAVIEP